MSDGVMAGINKHPKISAFMRELLDEYQLLRGNPNGACGKAFWDIVVLTASDEAQQKAFQLQIDEKKLRQELPLELTIHVVSDPPGIRIGNGGSTLTCLEFLHETYGERLYEFKVLLVHAGGWSQRMPSATVLGKVFSVLPYGNPPFQMLDLKLALYWPFVERIRPGVFLVCADDFLVFDVDKDKEWKIPGQGFTALAHPAPLEVGKSHGVFVLDDAFKMDTSKTLEIRECLKVLQKPTESRMKMEGAPLAGSSFSFGDGIHLVGDVVYTDSCFYFGVDIMRKLLKLKQSIGDLSCEIDAFGDFLQSVGKNATNEYIHLISNVSQPTPNLLDMRQKVFETLNGSNMHVLVLNSSKFIHIGTTKELLHHFCRDEEFQHQLCMQKSVFNQWTNGKKNKLDFDENLLDNETTNHPTLSDDVCLVHCALHKDSVLGSDCFLEFCHFDLPVTLSTHCILSNCQISLKELRLESIFIPSHSFLHTIPIHDENLETKYVTIYFHTEDNIKKSICVQELGSLPFLGSDIDFFLNKQGIDMHSILTDDQLKSLSKAKQEDEITIKESDVPETKVSLWNLRLYKAYDSMTTSLEETVKILNSMEHQTKRPKLSSKLYSMADLLQAKNVEGMLNFRRLLFQKISNQ